MRVRKNVFVLIIWKNSEMFIQKHNKNNKQLTLPSLRHEHNQLKQQMKKSSHSFTYLIYLLNDILLNYNFLCCVHSR